MSKEVLKKYVFEGLLIVFSVLFALFINKLFDDYKTQQKKEIAIESIVAEIERNAAILEKWKIHHRAIGDRITSMLNGEADSLKAELQSRKYFDLAVLTDQQSLIDDILSNTAWESAKTTGIISEFDFKSTEKLTQVYTMQDVIGEKTIMKILDFYFDSASHDLENIDMILLQFQLRFWELTGQEELMTYLYSSALNELKENNSG